MEHYTEFTGKTSEEAIEEGLKELGLKREEADIRILEEGKKKLFGFTKARVEIAPKSSLNAFEGDLEEESPTPSTSYADADKNAAEDELEGKTERQSEIHVDASGRTDGERAVEFLEGLFDILKITAVTELKKEAEKIEINVTAANTTAVIGKRGAMLDAIQTIAGAVANTGRAEYKRVVVDCENYRENREATLQSLAKRLAEKAIRFEKKLKLEPMNPYERRIIHAALSDYPDVTTQSEGKEPYRYVVIVPANVRYPDRPASPVRPERPQRGGYNDRGNDRGGYRKPYNREYGDRDGYRKPYNRDGNSAQGGGGYKKPYNRDNQSGDGYKKPYNREGGYNRDRYNSGRGYDRRGENGEGGTDLSGERRDSGRSYDKPRTSYKKPTSDFFGTYLGNSKDNKDDE